MFFFSLLICVIVCVCFICYHLCGEIKYIIFRQFGEKPPTVPIKSKICMAGNLADVITCAVMIFLGVTILQGVEFPIFLLIFFAWALQQCSATALPVKHVTKW